MNTLFVFELHTIREDPFVCERIVSDIAHTVHKHRSSPELWRKIKPQVLLTKSKFAVSASYIATLPGTVQAELLRMAAKWDDDTIGQWINLMRGEGKIAELYWDILEYLRKKHSVEMFVYWGSNHTIKKFAEMNGLHSIAMELGPMRTPFTENRYCDFAGVNGDSHTRIVDLNRFAGMDLEKWCHEGGIRYQSNAGYESRFWPVSSKFSDKIYRSGKPQALLVMQLDDDSNCLIHSDYSNMLHMLKETVPPLVEAGYQVYVKPHPAAHPDVNKGRARWLNVEGHENCRIFLEEQYGTDGDAVWLDDVPATEYISLLDRMDVVVSVNSSVGFEAMLMGKKVVTLGNAPYNVGNRLPTLQQIIDGEVDDNEYHELSRRIGNLLLNYYLYPADLLNSPTLLSQAIYRNIMLEDAYAAGGSERLSEAVAANPVQLHGNWS